jgi:DNA-binding GntR family transcriptional regulator
VEEVFELRICLEGLAAERVAERGLSGEDLGQLRRLLSRRNEGSSDAERTLHHADANRTFHEMIVTLSGNRKLAQIYTGLNAHTMMAFIHYASPTWSERWPLEIREHKRILKALEHGDPKEAREAMEAHLRRGNHLLNSQRVEHHGLIARYLDDILTMRPI